MEDPIRGNAMKYCRARAVILLEVGEKADIPEIKLKAPALAQMWLTMAALKDEIALWTGEAKGETVKQ
jgi:hypothetical protein